MFDINKLNKKQELVEDLYGSGYLESMYEKDKIVLRKKDYQLNIILDVLKLLKETNNKTFYKFLFYTDVNENRIIIELKYKIDNKKYVLSLKKFLEKYKRKTFSNVIVNL